jgi:hypothetical protein
MSFANEFRSPFNGDDDRCFPPVATGAAGGGRSGEARASARAVRGGRGSSAALADTTYLLGLLEPGNDAASLAWLHVGARLLLRRRPQTSRRAGGQHRGVEVCALDGRLLGHLPPDDANAVAALLDDGVPATARVSALVPAFRRQRVQLAIEVEE